MKIPCVEEYHELELRWIPYISKMLFPDKIGKKKPASEDERLSWLNEMNDWLNSEDENKFSHPASKENTGNYRLRRVWLARRSFVAMEEIHTMVLHHENGSSDDAREYIYSKFNDYLRRHGGWLNLGQDAGYDHMEDMVSMTFAQASKGFLSGHIIKHCIDNMCNVEVACSHISDNFDLIARPPYADFQYNKEDDKSQDDLSRLLKSTESFPTTFRPSKSKYSSGHLRQNVWNEMKSVAYAWAAAVDLFGNATNFTNRMVSSARPFDFGGVETSPSDGHATFVSRANHYFSLATIGRCSPKRKLPPLIKNNPQFLFGRDKLFI